MAMNGDEIWSFTGKALAIIGGVVGVIKIIEWYTSPKGKLTAIVENVPFELPEIKKSALDNFSRNRAMWIVVVSNNGSKSCAETALTLPDTSVAIIQRAGADKELRQLKDGIIELGIIKPKEKINVFAWSSWPADFDKVSLSHAAGLGKVLARASAPKFIHDIEAVVKFFKPMMFWAVLGGLVGGLIAGGGFNFLNQNLKNGNKSDVTNLTPLISSQPTNSIHP
jgi:hypothetical protein